MQRLLKILGKTLLVLLLLPVAFYLFLVLYNLRDDALDPELAKLLADRPPQIPAADNGYFAWIGVMGPESQDPHAWGSRWLQEALAADQRASEAGNGAEGAISKEKRQPEMKSEALPCFKVDACLATVARDLAAARTALEQVRVTLERGDKAMAYSAYQEPLRPDASITSALPPIPTLWRHLSATRFALAVAEGRHDEGLAGLGREIAFHRRQLQGSHSLLDKMLAVSHLKSGYGLLGQYLQAYPAEARARGEALQALLAPLPKEAVSLQPSILTELQLATRLTLSLKDKVGMDSTVAMLSSASGDAVPSAFGGALAAPLMLPNATANEGARLVRPWLAVDGFSDGAYRQAVADAHANLVRETADTYVLRNPVGHILTLVAVMDYQPYFFRRDDLLALQAATAFRLDLLRRQVEDSEAVAQAVAASPSLVHPYTGAAPVWDKSNRTLSYPALPPRQNKPLTIPF